MVKIPLCGTNTWHGNGYSFSTDSLSDYLLMCFKTPFFYTVNGIVRTGCPGDCLMHRPKTAVSHGPMTDDTCFINDWIYFPAESADEIEALGLPFDTALHTSEGAAITSCISGIMQEGIMHDSYSDRIISDHLHHLLILFKRSTYATGQDEAQESDRFRGIRAHILGHYQREWSLQQMAELSCYSVSRFCALYHRCFGISPTADLLKMRLERAKQLLLTRAYSVGDVATMCGFSSIHYFSHFFKKHEHITPSEYAGSQ